MKEKGYVMHVQRFSLNDGPGIRSTAFLKGCSLRCAWCHNPESWKTEPQTLYYEKKCVHCGACARGGAEACLYGARVMVGRLCSAEELVTLLLRDMRFFARGGGVTFSGGETLLQADFTAVCLRELKKAGVHTCVDTALHVPAEAVQAVIPYTDLFLADLKSINPDVHRQITGAGNHMILDNLRLISRTGIPMWIRMPLAAGINDSPEDLRKTADFLSGLAGVVRVDLLPVLDHADEKYRALGLEPPRFSRDVDVAALIHRAAGYLDTDSRGTLPLHQII